MFADILKIMFVCLIFFFGLFLFFWGVGGDILKALLAAQFLFDMQHDNVLKKLNYDLLTQTSGSGWVWYAGKIFATMLLQS